MSTGAGPFAELTPRMVVDLLMQAFTGQEQPSPAQVDEQVVAFLTGPFAGLRVRKDEILEEVLRRIEVRIGTASTLDDNTGHVEWLRDSDRRAWSFWPRLEDYLRREDRLPPAVLLELAAPLALVGGKVRTAAPAQRRRTAATLALAAAPASAASR